MKTTKTLRTCLFVGLAAVLASPCLRADDPASKMSIELGGAYGQVDVTGGTSDLAGAAAALSFQLGKLLMTDLGVRADYSYLESQDAGFTFKRELFDADVRFGLSVMRIFKPYLSAGLSYHRYSAPSTFVESDWKVGGAVGVGVGITIIPALLHITPSIRYVSYDSLETVTYAVDTALHFSVVGVGLRLSYEDDRTHEAHLSTATLYAALRF